MIEELSQTLITAAQGFFGRAALHWLPRQTVMDCLRLFGVDHRCACLKRSLESYPVFGRYAFPGKCCAVFREKTPLVQSPDQASAVKVGFGATGLRRLDQSLPAGNS